MAMTWPASAFERSSSAGLSSADALGTWRESSFCSARIASELEMSSRRRSSAAMSSSTISTDSPRAC